MKCRRLWMIGLLLLGLPASGQQSASALQKISRAELERGRQPERLVPDATVRKHKGQLQLSVGCPVLEDNSQLTDFHEYQYVGKWTSPPRMQVAAKQSYNGEQYVVVWPQKGCRQYLLNGRPYRYGTLVVNFDETRTTDRLGTIYFWRLTTAGLVRIGKLEQQRVIPGSLVRFSADGKNVFFEDQQQLQCWMMAVPQ